MNSESNDQKKQINSAYDEAIVREKPNVCCDDVLGLQKAKTTLKEAIVLPLRFPQLFTGNHRPWKGILLYGPPGVGKKLLIKACASEVPECTLLSINMSVIFSKYIGVSQNIVKKLFDMAREQKKCIISLENVDLLAVNRSQGCQEHKRRAAVEFMLQIDSSRRQRNHNTIVVGTTNMPWEIYTALLKRFQKRIYIPLPELATRYFMFKKLCQKIPNTLSQGDFKSLAEKSKGYSGQDISKIVKNTVSETYSQNKPRDIQFDEKLTQQNGKQVHSYLQYIHFVSSLLKVKPSVDQAQLNKYRDFFQKFEQQWCM